MTYPNTESMLLRFRSDKFNHRIKGFLPAMLDHHIHTGYGDIHATEYLIHGIAVCATTEGQDDGFVFCCYLQGTTIQQVIPGLIRFACPVCTIKFLLE